MTIGTGAFLGRNVEIDAHQDALTADLEIANG